MDKASVDVVAIYCPDVDTCFYVDPSLFGGAITLRLEPTKNCQQIGVSYAEWFRELPGPREVARMDQAGPSQLVSSTLFR